MGALRYSLAEIDRLNEKVTSLAAQIAKHELRLFAVENTLDAWRDTSDRALRGLETRLTELETRCDERQGRW